MTRRSLQSSQGTHAARRPWMLVETYFSVPSAREIYIVWCRLKRRYFAFIHTQSAGVNRAIGRILRRCLDKYYCADGRANAFVLAQLIGLFTKLNDLVLKVTGVACVRFLRLCERECRRIELEQLVAHCDLDLVQLDGVSGFERTFCCPPGCSDGGDCFGDAHKSSPNVEKGCVRTPDSTLRGTDDGEGGYA